MSENGNGDKAAEQSKQLTPVQQISRHLNAKQAIEKFAGIYGEKGGRSYIASVMVVVNESQALQKCTPDSIFSSALRAASLQLSVEPGLGEAYVVPYGGRAVLVVGYRGLYKMAIRTGKYRYINVGKIYEGQVCEENQITGFHSITGGRTSDKVIGWIGAFEMNPERGQTTGFGHTIYMTVEEIASHAKQYSKSYGTPNKEGVLVDKFGKPTVWHTEKEKMESKTVLRLLLRRWGYLAPADVQVLEELESESDTIDLEPTDSGIYVPYEEDEKEEEVKRLDPEESAKKRARNLHELGFE